MSVFMTPAQLAERWACSPGHVRRLCRAGALPAMRLGSDWRIATSAVEAYEQRQTSAPVEPAAPTSAPKVAVAATTAVDGISLPADYEPVFRDLWPGHEATKRKRLSAATDNR